MHTTAVPLKGCASTPSSALLEFTVFMRVNVGLERLCLRSLSACPLVSVAYNNTVEKDSQRAPKSESNRPMYQCNFPSVVVKLK